MLLKIVFFLLFSLSLYAQTILKKTYFIEHDKVYLSDIIANTQTDHLLYTINSYKHSKRVKTKEFIKLLKQHGIKDIKSSSNYIKFQVKSPIDLSIIEVYLLQYYKEKYPQIVIENIEVHSRGYIDFLPNEYTVEMKNRNYLSYKGIVNIKTSDRKKLFFNYKIKANLKVLVAKKRIKRGNPLSLLNTQYKTIRFDKFRARPLTKLHKNSFQAGRHIKIDEVITLRDVKKLDLVHKNAEVIVSLDNNGLSITFTAKALQSGTLGDIITIQKTDLKRLKATVIGAKRVQIK